MSRICVKNLPRYMTEDRLREHFAAKGEVTDAKIIRTSDGRSRQFGFVGYRTEEEAEAAVKYFNRSFIDTFRLCCEAAQPVGNPNLPRPWSRHSQGSSAYNKAHAAPEPEEQGSSDRKQVNGKGIKKDSKDNDEDDPQLLEFLQVMQPRSKTKLWENDTLVATQKNDKKQEKKSNSEILSGGKLNRNQAVNTAQDVAFFVDEGTEDIQRQDNADTVDVVKDEAVSDLDYLKSRVRSNWLDDDEDSETIQNTQNNGEEEEDRNMSRSDPGNTNDTNLEWNGETERATASAADDEELAELEKIEGVLGTVDTSHDHGIATVVAEEQESVSETGRLFVRNLSYTTSEEDLVELFGRFGELSQVHLVLDKVTKRSKGLAYILYMLPEAAVRAMDSLDKSIFQGRLLHILPAKRPPPAPEKNLNISSGGPGMSKFKQEREAQRRAEEARGNTRAWNSFFMHPDNVAENVARNYGLSKGEFLDPEAEDLAVRMALGETHIIAETKRALREEGINVGILEDLASGKLDKVKRSKYVILVKNLPFTTTETDLLTMFGKFGSLERVILPPTRTLALVVYLEAVEARTAFKGLAYKRFKHVPLYLEWAPENILIGKQSSLVKAKEYVPAFVVGEDQVKRVAVEQELTGTTDDIVDLDTAESRSVFIKNLNFKTSEKAMKHHFQQNLKQGVLRSATIKMKPSKSGNLLSMGFGFIEFDSVETAKNVCKQLQGTILDGHALVLQMSRGRKEVSAEKNKETSILGKTNKKASSTKMIVRNVAFEATKKDLKQLFSPFGQIKSLRLPKKFDGNHRGFAFVEFITKQEAENAYNALSSTHLYGRHLVLEQAKEGESLDELRARTATQFSEEADGTLINSRPSKRRKQTSLLDDRDVHFGQIAQ